MIENLLESIPTRPKHDKVEELSEGINLLATDIVGELQHTIVLTIAP